MAGKLGFGCMRLPITDPENTASIDDAQVCEMFDLFLERGFTYFDTAWMYHSHESENAVRRCLVERHPRESFTVTTKMPIMSISTEAEQADTFEKQLEKVGVEYFDYYLAHNVNANTWPIAQRLKTFEFMAEQKAAGRIKHVGFSFHDAPELLDEVLTAHPEVEVVQLQINYLDWDDAGIQSRRNYEVAAKHGKKVIVMEPVRGGSLAKLPPSAAELLEQADPSASQASWAIRFAASLPEVFMVLSGMSDLSQVEDNTSYMADMVELSEDERQLLARVADIIHGDKEIPCTSCRYCVAGCPMDIPIPNYFTLYNNHKRNPNEFHPQMYYRNFTLEHGKASDCIGCRACVGSCPQGIEIPDMLELVAGAFEPVPEGMD